MTNKTTRTTLILALLLLALLTVADKSSSAWAGVRALWLLGIALLATRHPQRLPAALAVGFGLIALGGVAALDFAVAALGFAMLRVRLSHWATLTAAVGVTGTLALAVTRWWPEFAPALLPFHNRNHYSVFCELSLPVLVYAWRRTSATHWLRLALPVAATAMVVTALAAGSRVGAVLLLGEILLLALAITGREKVWTMAPATIVAASIFVLWHGGVRLTQPLEGDHRLEIWQSTVAMISEKPLAGWGAGKFAPTYPAYARFDNGQIVQAAHSDWLEWTFEYGIPAAILFAAAFAWWCRKTLHFYPSWGILVGALHSVVDFPFHLPGLLVFSATLAGSLYANAQVPSPQSSNRKRRNSKVPATGRIGSVLRRAGHVAEPSDSLVEQ